MLRFSIQLNFFKLKIPYLNYNKIKPNCNEKLGKMSWFFNMFTFNFTIQTTHTKIPHTFLR